MSEDGSKVVESAGPRKPPSAGIGRKKGVPNKATKAVKEALQEAFEGLGGVPSLVEWAKSEPTEFYKLWSKIMPTEVKAEVTNIGESPVGKIQIEIISANPEHQGD